MRSDNPECDWVEDFTHENGNYQCQCIDCGKLFFGHKRRVVCKVCDKPVPVEAPKESISDAYSFNETRLIALRFAMETRKNNDVTNEDTRQSFDKWWADNKERFLIKQCYKSPEEVEALLSNELNSYLPAETVTKILSKLK